MLLVLTSKRFLHTDRGLPKVPASDNIDIDADDNIVGLCNSLSARRAAAEHAALIRSWLAKSCFYV